ncbi:MAG: hypothetical protein LBS38_03495 [Endomicrobium sp.]|jgi:hypothetical protein|nr:hypothetical protein [Endomicrobium sp.]
MKKIVFLCLILTIIGLGIFSCGLKDRLLHNTITVVIEPASIEFIRFDSSQHFSAIVRNARGEFMDVGVKWRISGFTDVSISSNQGTSITLQTGSTECRGVLTAEYRGVTSSINIEVTNDVILYKNGKWSNIIDLNSLIYNPPDNSNLVKMEEVTDDKTGNTCLQFTVSRPEVQKSGAFFLTFKRPQDLSGYNNIQFSARCAVGSYVTFVVYMIKNNGQPGYQEEPYVPNIKNDWTICRGGLTKQRDNVVSPLQIEFRHDDIPSGETRTIRINDIRIE